MKNEFTAVYERDGDWFVAYCPEVPGANGLGRTKEECQASLFQPFRQAGQETARLYGGTGLGLAICRRLTEAMGGSIGLVSNARASAIFCWVPRERCSIGSPTRL